MNFRNNTDISETELKYKTIYYGEQTPTTLSSDATPFEFTDLVSKGNLCSASSGTSTDINVEIPDPLWFINNKSQGIIVFFQGSPLPEEMTEAQFTHTELHQNKAAVQFKQAFRKIGKFFGLSDNWDTYGAKAIDKDCLSQSIDILKALVKRGSVVKPEIPTPFIAPLSAGGIQIEWEKGERYLEISITPNPTTINYFAMDMVKRGQLTLGGPLRSLSALEELLTWFVNGTAADLANIAFEEVNYE